MGTDRSIQDQIAQYNWYQSIELTDGIVTPGETGMASQNKLAMMNLPADLSGKTVLDIGCNEGFFAFEAERRHAARVVAIDKGKDAREKFGLVHRILHSKVEFLELDLTEIKPSRFGRFDVVFFLAVLHHLRHPFWAFDQVFELTGEMALLEFVEAVSEAHPEVSAMVRRKSKKGHMHMLPTRTMSLELLDRAGFSRVEVLGAHRAKSEGEHRAMPGFSQQRVLLKAYR